MTTVFQYVITRPFVVRPTQQIILKIGSQVVGLIRPFPSAELFKPQQTKKQFAAIDPIVTISKQANNNGIIPLKRTTHIYNLPWTLKQISM